VSADSASGEDRTPCDTGVCGRERDMAGFIAERAIEAPSAGQTVGI